MIEFSPNKYITLKLENGKTNIYVGNELFRQCKFLLLDIVVEKVATFDEIESIDDAIERFNKNPENKELEIAPKAEFWGHCSNIQVWVEYQYDTRLLQINLAFPLLRKLSDFGDPLAKKAFKEEIIKRLEAGSQNTIDFLFKEGYTRYLDDEEIIFSLLDIEEFNNLKKLEDYCRIKLCMVQNRDENGIKIENRRVIHINLQGLNIKDFPDVIEGFPFIEYLDVSNNNIEILPKTITGLTKLKTLKLSDNRIENIDKSIYKLMSLEILELGNNKIIEIPKTVKSLTNLKVLNLGLNEITELPDEIRHLKSLEKLILNSNKLKILPESIGNLTLLKELYLEYNNLQNLPNQLFLLKNLEGLYLSHNSISCLPERMENLRSLRFLHLDNNNLLEIPNSITELKRLKVLDLRNNKDRCIPKKLLKKITNIKIL